MPRHRSRRRRARPPKTVLVVAALIAWGWATSPALTVVAITAAALAWTAWHVHRRDAERQQLAAAGQETWLYRHYAHDGRLLYVGVTNDYERRCEQHADDKWWWPQVDLAASTVQVFPNRLAALRAERDAIRAERPVHNIAHNGRRRLAA